MIDSHRELFDTSSQKNQSNWDDRHIRFELLARIASLYYLEEKTQDEIAHELGLSRQKVQRLLRQAREKRIVEIHVHAIPVHHLQLETRLKEIFGLSDAVVAPYHPDEEQARYSVAQAAASTLERRLKEDSIVAVGLGRNTSEVANFFHPARAFGCTFVSAMGGSPQTGTRYNPNEICTRFATHSGSRAQLLYAPAYVANREFRDMLLAQEAIQATIQIARRADIGVMGIGAANDDSILTQAGCQTVEEVRQLRSVGAVGEILGNYFDLEGRKVSADLDERVISLSLSELQAVPQVIAVASEREKVRALLGALRTRVINTLVTNCDLAIDVLRLAGVQNLEEEQELFEDI